MHAIVQFFVNLAEWTWSVGWWLLGAFACVIVVVAVVEWRRR